MYINNFTEGVYYSQTGHTALWHSCFRGNAQLVKLLTEHGAQIDLQNNV
jgi:ankyrin repeat protein